MPKSLPMLPEEQSLAAEDLIYLVKSSAGSARDKKVALDTLRQFCTAQGVRLIEVPASGAASGAVYADVSGSTGVILLLTGSGAEELEVRISGTVPEGCGVTLISAYSGKHTYVFAGTSVGASPGILWNHDWMTATYLSAVWYHVVLRAVDHQEQALEEAVSAEATLRATADSALQTAISGEATLRKDAFASLQTNLNAINENLSSIVTAHTNEIASIDTRVAALESMNGAFVAIDIPESSSVGSSGTPVGQFTVPAGQQWALSASVRVEASPADSDSAVKVRSIYINVKAAGTGTIGIGTIPDLYAPAETGGADTVHGGGSITALIPSASTSRAVAIYVVPTTSNGATFSIKGGRIIAWRLS